MKTDAEKIELMKRAMTLLDHAGILLVEATRDHYQASYKAYPGALLDKNGNDIEIDMDGIGDKPICVELMMVGRQARADAAKIKDAITVEDDQSSTRMISKEEAAPILIC